MPENLGENRASDRAVAGFCDLLGLMLALPFGEDLHHGAPITNANIVYAILGLASAVMGHMWPRIKGVVPQRVADTVAQAALDFRLWVAVLLIVFVISIGPEVYLRVVGASQLPAPWLVGVEIGIAIIAFVVLWGAHQGRAKALPNDLTDRISAIEQEVAQNKAKIDRIEARVESNRKQETLYYDILVKALRARDAEAVIKAADQNIISLGRKLLETPYSDETDWTRDYAVWEKAMGRVDGILPEWTENHMPFLNDRLRDVERDAPGVPGYLELDINKMRYKIVYLAQQSYANRRDNILIYFSTKGQLP